MPAAIDRLSGWLPHPPGIPDPDGGSLKTLGLLFKTYSEASTLSSEVCAILEDTGLQARIVSRAVANLRRLRALSSGQPSAACGLQDSQGSVEDYESAAWALVVLSMTILLPGVRAAARSSPCFVEEIVAATELFIRLDPPPDMGPERETEQLRALAAAVQVMRTACELSAHGSPLPFKDLLRCVRVAAAALLHILQSNCDKEQSTELQDLSVGFASMLIFVVEKSLGPLPDCAVPPGTDVGSWPAYYQALEAMLRLAAVMPASLPGDLALLGIPEGDETTKSITIIVGLENIFSAVWNYPPSAPPEDEVEAWGALAGLVDSATKFAVRLEGPGGAGGGDDEFSTQRDDCMFRMVEKVANFCERLEGKEGDEGFPTR